MFKGLSAFPITPAAADGRIDTDALQTLLARLVDAGVDSIGLLGSTGAYPFFTREERRRAVAAAVECVAGRTALLVGVGALRTDAAVALAEDAKAAGADAGLLAPVSYTPLLDDEVLAHFQAVAAAGLPLCIYNNPGTTHFDIGPDLVGRLAEVPGVVAVKTGAPPEGAEGAVAALRTRVPAGFSVGFSVDWNAPAALMAGGDAWYSVVAGIYPRTLLRLARAAAARDAAETQRLHERLEPIWRLSRAYSSFRVVHLAAARAGIANAVPQRPLLPLSGAAAADVERVLDELDLD
ncbi:MAG: dihydrodipicolinate synthase family protein [Acetobacteraceae bacterium]|nr:dihydrodipicolinate synthase family protein [Acetobacteraceae bacterium]